MDLIKYTKSLLGGPPRSHGPINAAQLVIGSCMAGYTVTHLPAEFLVLFEHPVSQYIVFFILFNTSHGEQTPGSWAFIDAFLLTIIVNAAIYLIQEYYKNKAVKKAVKKAAGEIVISEATGTKDAEEVVIESAMGGGSLERSHAAHTGAGRQFRQ